ncbi:MAG: sigma 54-interacting transcriptional regulator [Bdellovibrionaceae bacterium]|nr:sigma 54-interacting transcriptional regulator [Pseudobdellovibrionaceae bacterium]
MFQMLKEIEAAKNSPYPTLIIGETGTGKELIAQALVPKGKKMISINCASFLQRENLLESELFGYVRGAFTGANADTVGLVAKANYNVLFLDELHQLPLSAQAKLLRFLQEMKFRRVGDNSDLETKANFKLVAAVQPDIKERLIDKSFLTDLFERVGTLVINAPALRNKSDDIELLVRFFQNEYNKGKDHSVNTVARTDQHRFNG